MATKKEETLSALPITGPVLEGQPAPEGLAEQLAAAAQAVESATEPTVEPENPVCYPTDFLKSLGIQIGNDGDSKRYDGSGNALN